MKKQSILVFALFICYSAAISQTPAITMTSSMAVASDFYFTIEATNPQIQVDFGDGTLISKTIGTSPITGDPSILSQLYYPDNTISGKLAGTKTVKVYGTGITTLICFGLNTSKMTFSDSLTSLDVSNCNTLRWLDCSKSQLTTIDVSKNTVLRFLVCSSNQLTNLDVSNNTGLEWLDCSINKLATLDVSNNTTLSTLLCSTNKLANLNVSKNTVLKSLECNANQLTSLDVSNHIELWNLRCSLNQLASLDVSHDQISWLDCSSNKLTSMDVSQDTVLYMFYCNSNQISSLDLKNNKLTFFIYCMNNQLTNLDVSHCTYLNTLLCNDNQLSTLDVNKNTQLSLFICNNNRFTFATLPTIPFPVIYAPQIPIFIDKDLGTGIELDLSSQLIINGNTTTYTWKTKSGTTLVQDTDYSLANGKTVFLKSQMDSVYCEMTNAGFPGFIGNNVLKTTCTKVMVNTGASYATASEVQIYARNKTVYIVAPYNGKVSVYDINGRPVKITEITTGTNTIAMQKLGVYLVRFTGSFAPVIKKVFIEN